MLPEEKLKLHGTPALSDIELVQLVLRTGSYGMPVAAMAQEVVLQARLHNYDFSSIQELLRKVKIYPSKAAAVLAILELGKRWFSDKKQIILDKPSDFVTYCPELRDSPKEIFLACYLNTRNHLLKKEVISIGTVSASLVHPREVFEPAIRHLASSIVVLHNHPSGDPEPSDADINITKRLCQAGDILGIELLDHIIIANQRLYSFRATGLMR